MPFTCYEWSYLSVDSLEKKQSSLGPPGGFGLPVTVLVGMGGGRVGNTEGPEDNQSGSESNTEREGRVWDTRGVGGKMGACGVLVEDGKSSSNVTHC